MVSKIGLLLLYPHCIPTVSPLYPHCISALSAAAVALSTAAAALLADMNRLIEVLETQHNEHLYSTVL